MTIQTGPAYWSIYVPYIEEDKTRVSAATRKERYDKVKGSLIRTKFKSKDEARSAADTITKMTGVRLSVSEGVDMYL